MKTKVYCLCALMASGVAMTSCGNGEKDSQANDTLASVEVSDSISEYYGVMAGSYINGELTYYARESGEGYDRKEFVRGIEAVLKKEHSDAYIAGMNTAMRLNQDMNEMKKQGVRVDRKKVLDAVSKYILADSVPDSVRNDAAAVYQRLMGSVQKANQDREEARKAKSPEAVKNVKTAEAFLDKQMKENPAIKKTRSGLAYVLTNPGTGEKYGENQRIKVKYTGRHINGEVFDSNDEATFSLGTGMTEGINEVLELLSPGASGTFYIPGKLAFGANGIPQVGIGPMEMVVYEMEVLPETDTTVQTVRPAAK